MQDDNKSLSVVAKQILANTNSELFISIASFWEITIKSALGKIELGYTIEDLQQACDVNDIIMLPIEMSTLTNLKSLPLIHRDPFDRIIIATAADLDLQILTLDPNIGKYKVQSVW